MGKRSETSVWARLSGEYIAGLGVGGKVRVAASKAKRVHVHWRFFDLFPIRRPLESNQETKHR